MKVSMLIFILVLLLSGAVASQQKSNNTTPWVMVAESVITRDFVNPATITDLGAGQRQIWTMTEYKAPQLLDSGKQFQSDKTLYSVSCTDKTSAIITATIYSQPGGKGEVVLSYMPEASAAKAQPVVAGTSGDRILKAACNN